jgi:hypothetical protein
LFGSASEFRRRINGRGGCEGQDEAFSAVGAVLDAETAHIDRFGFEMSVRTAAGTETVRTSSCRVRAMGGTPRHSALAGAPGAGLVRGAPERRRFRMSERLAEDRYDGWPVLARVSASGTASVVVGRPGHVPGRRPSASHRDERRALRA